MCTIVLPRHYFFLPSSAKALASAFPFFQAPSHHYHTLILVSAHSCSSREKLVVGLLCKHC